MDPPATSTSSLARAERAARSTLPPLIEPSLSSRVINWFNCFLPANICDQVEWKIPLCIGTLPC